MVNPYLFVISGGPGSGKTTVLEELARRGVPHAPEVARRIIRQQVETNGNALPWGDREAYTRLMLQGSIESYLERTSIGSPEFTDRGIPDTLGYARLIGIPHGYIWDACREYRYAPLVFLAPPWEEIYVTDNERKQTFAEVGHTFNHVVDVYTECGYDLCILPKTSPQERADFMLDRLRDLPKPTRP